jgi:hypothetical protein
MQGSQRVYFVPEWHPVALVIVGSGLAIIGLVIVLMIRRARAR